MCASCGRLFAEAVEIYRCQDCVHGPLSCSTCVVSDHINTPFHRVDAWLCKRKFWEKCSLANLGLIIDLGHGGQKCPLALTRTRNMTIVHTNGVHDFAVRFCSCLASSPENGTLPEPIQLIRYGLWPASWSVPQTAFSISMLRDYQLLSLQSQLSAHDYFMYLRRKTDNVFPDTIRVPISR